MFLVNYVYDDEELLEPYEWQDDDNYKEYSSLPIYHIPYQMLHDFMYDKLYLPDMKNNCFVVSDLHYCFVVQLKNHYIDKRGSVTFQQRILLNQEASHLPMTLFQYQVIEEAYEKEFGLTRQERMKKICLEEMIDEIFVVHYDLFLEICQQLHIEEDTPSDLYLALKHKIEKGYSSLHELLYKELIQKR